MVSQDSFGLRQLGGGIFAFDLDTDDELTLVQGIDVILSHSLSVAVGQNETAEAAGDGPTADEHRYGRQHADAAGGDGCGRQR